MNTEIRCLEQEDQDRWTQISPENCVSDLDSFLKNAFLDKSEHNCRQSLSSWNEAGYSGPAPPALIKEGMWPWTCWEGEDTASGVQLLHISSFTPPVGCDHGQAAPGSISLHVPGALFNVVTWCLRMLWLTGDPLLAAVGHNSPSPQRFSPSTEGCGCTHTSEAGGILAMPQALSSLQADPWWWIIFPSESQ